MSQSFYKNKNVLKNVASKKFSRDFIFLNLVKMEWEAKFFFSFWKDTFKK